MRQQMIFVLNWVKTKVVIMTTPELWWFNQSQLVLVLQVTLCLQPWVMLRLIHTPLLCKLERATKMARKRDKQPPKTKKYFRSTKSGAGMTKHWRCSKVYTRQPQEVS